MMHTFRNYHLLNIYVQPWAFESREFLRAFAVGKEVSFISTHSLPPNEEIPRDFGTAEIGGLDLGSELLKNGWAKLKELKREPTDEDIQKRDIESEAKTSGQGLWNPHGPKVCLFHRSSGFSQVTDVDCRHTLFITQCQQTHKHLYLNGKENQLKVTSIFKPYPRCLTCQPPLSYRRTSSRGIHPASSSSYARWRTPNSQHRTSRRPECAGVNQTG
jgi:hypothetical protein